MNLKLIGAIAAALFVLWAGTLQYRFSEKKQALAAAKVTIKADKVTKDSLNSVVIKLQAKAYTDSTNHAHTVADLQTLVQTAKAETQAYKKENTDLKAGLYRYRVNIFGKEKLEKIN
jgi:uncharacterized membrane protein YgaE (UPF0421/DUF939 family)